MRTIVAILIIFSIISIWLAILEGLIIILGALKFHQKDLQRVISFEHVNWGELPTVTVLVPAHNEELVIETTVQRILKMNYPHDKLQLIVINDNSSDSSSNILKSIEAQNRNRMIKIIEITDKEIGGGKAKALNHAVKFATGEYICVYDADAAPEQNALLFLVLKVLESDKYAAAFGRNKTRNRKRNNFTKMINLELIVTQRVVHPGKWELLKLGQIPGTNFIIKKSILEEIGWWDTAALTEDTELGFKLMEKGFQIALETRSEAYQQEPEEVAVYIHQRVRWAKGNLYVLHKNFSKIFTAKNIRIRAEAFYYFSTYIWFLLAVVLSDIFFITSILFIVLSWFGINFSLPVVFSPLVSILFIYSWALMYFIFVLQINLALATDIGQSTTKNFVLSCVSYFTYAQLFIYVSVRATFEYTLDKILHRKQTWYKTKRF